MASITHRFRRPLGRHPLCFPAHGRQALRLLVSDPPAEVLATGHDRLMVPIRAGNVTAWLNPDPKSLAAQYAILDDRERFITGTGSLPQVHQAGSLIW